MSDSNKKVPTHEQIALRAFEIYLQRGGESGELDDWFAAEKELTESRERDAHEPNPADVTPLRKRAADGKR